MAFNRNTCQKKVHLVAKSSKCSRISGSASAQFCFIQAHSVHWSIRSSKTLSPLFCQGSPLNLQTVQPFQTIPPYILFFYSLSEPPCYFILNPIPSLKVTKFLGKFPSFNSQLWHRKTFLYISLNILSLNISDFSLFQFYVKTATSPFLEKVTPSFPVTFL